MRTLAPYGAVFETDRQDDGRGIRCAKISTLALDERAPHGFVGYANPATASHGENPLPLNQKERFNPTRMG